MKDVATIFNPLTEKVAPFLLYLEVVVSQASKALPDQLIILSPGLLIEGTSVQELTLTPGSLGGGHTQKQTINIGPYRGRQVLDAVGDHSLVDMWSDFHPHGQDVPLIHSRRGTEGCQRMTVLREWVEDGSEMVPMLSLEEVLNDR